MPPITATAEDTTKAELEVYFLVRRRRDMDLDFDDYYSMDEQDQSPGLLLCVTAQF